MANNSMDNSRKEFVTASGRRFISDVQKDFHYTSFETKKILKEYSPESSSPALYKKTSVVNLEPHVTLNHDKLSINFNIYSGTTGHSYVLKDVAALLSAIDEREIVSYGKHLEFTHDLSAFSEESQKIISFLKDFFRGKQLGDAFSAYSSSAYSYGKGHNKELELTGHEIDEFFSAVSSIYFINTDFRSRYTEERPVDIVYSFPPIDLHIEKTANGINFEASSFTMFEGYSNIYFERRRKIHVIPRKECEDIFPFLKFLSARRTENELFISNKDLPLFSSGLYPILEEYFNVSNDGFYPSKYSPDIPKFKIYIDMPDLVTITCDIQAIYYEGKPSETTVRLFENSDGSSGNNGQENESEVIIKRNYYQESSIIKLVSQHFDELDNKKGLLILSGSSDNEDKLFAFIADDIPKLARLCDVYLSDAIKSVNISSAPTVSMGISVVSDLLELSIVPQEITAAELNNILGRYRLKKKYYRLSSGDIIDLQTREMDLLYSLNEGLGLSPKDILAGHISIPKYRALFLNELTDDNAIISGATIDKSKDFKDLVKSYATTGDKLFTVPKSLDKVMRDYQKDGFIWLRTLRYNGFGGILADDMGLGKTLQVLSLLLSIKEETDRNKKPNRCSLVVCPASLVYNWQHEIKRFTPHLKCELAVGIKADRERVTSEIEEEKTEVIITSYDLLRRDIDLYKYLEFDCQIIDEAQFIKNPTTQVAKAVKSIHASFKVALTGTPIENRLSELWSIFDYCMPGYLFNYRHFKEAIESPAILDGDEEAMRRLKRMISPFILRRLKKDVLKDLPDKLEENIYAPMAKEQEELYKAHLQRIKLMVDSKNEEDFRRDRIMILSELTRLRQLCCDPGLIYDNYTGGSAKADLCLEMIRSAAESGHKVLLFSQFTSMLERLTAILKKEGIKHYLLTGSTQKEDRIRMVDAFQEDDTPVFCISLKAGGTGLNLTAADIVIHYDHWWNIAVENQATDRAHRIGQKNVVTVYRLIMQNTIEERIILLQNKKKELADQLLNTDSLRNPTLSKEELLELLR
ncbi:DEAD/DEAH box helicase [Butyrivibrio proteoclasticus]|uniref:DEAD/DEAH box helicase n=1 Tax=Butyrivibrio proteoclasticus TaxID=43305 RepID=UPI000686557F|nr:SNF2 helicase associated domain-containing protein [Butyrivibrio proteoclasticus]